MRDELILNNLWLVNYIIFKLGIRRNFNNYYDAGLKALVIASDTFDKNMGNEFSSYASKCIKHEILKYIKAEETDKRKANINTISLDAPFCFDKNGDEIKLLDLLDNGVELEKELIEQEKINLLKTIIGILEPNDRFMIERYFELWGNEKMTQKEIAKFLNVKTSYVSYRIKRAMNIIKKIMEDKYEKEN